MSTEEKQTAAERLITIAAQRAAQEAAMDYERDLRAGESRFGVFAIYAWATVAFVASAIAGSALLFPNQTFQIRKEATNAPTRVAESQVQASKPTQQPVTSSPSSDPGIDQLKTGALMQVAPSAAEPTGRTAMPASLPSTPLGVQIGDITDLDSLVLRFASLQNSVPSLFDAYAPLVEFVEGEEITVKLIAGPFKSADIAEEFCSIIREVSPQSCEMSAYSGDPLLED